jgi:DNA-binding LacI/PurR family transcriptional regulator
MKWAINTLKPLISAGTDALLQHGMKHVALCTCAVFSATAERLECSSYLRACREARVQFISEPRKASCTEAKAYHLISTSPFLQKKLEKLVLTHITDKAMRTISELKLVCLQSREIH